MFSFTSNEDCTVTWTRADPGSEISESLNRAWPPHGPSTFVLSVGENPHLPEKISPFNRIFDIL